MIGVRRQHYTFRTSRTGARAAARPPPAQCILQAGRRASRRALRPLGE